MTDRMNHYETLDTKVNNKINEIKHLTNYNSTKTCNYDKLCFAIENFNGTRTTDLFKIYLLIDLVIVDAIDQGKQQEALEIVLEVNNND